MDYDCEAMKIFFLLIFLTVLNVGLTKRKHKNNAIKEELWRRHHINKRKHETGGNGTKGMVVDHKEDINVTKIYDHISKFHAQRPKEERGTKRSTYGKPIWQVDSLGNNEMKLLVGGGGIPKNNMNYVNAIRRSGYQGGGHRHLHHRYQHELYTPASEKMYDDTLTFLNRHDEHGPFHHYENGGHALLGGLTHGGSIVTHSMDYDSQPSQVYMHGIEKTQPGAINGGFLQPSPITLTMPNVHIHKKPLHLIKPHYHTTYEDKDERDFFILIED